MYRRIDEYGLDSKEALEVSQVIDLLINIKMKRDQLLSQLAFAVSYSPPYCRLVGRHPYISLQNH